MKRELKMNDKGFSLVELIVVIAIMAILVGALAPQFVKYIEKTNASTDMQNIAQLKSAVEAYGIDMASSSTGLSDSLVITINGTGTNTAVVTGKSGLTAAEVGLPNLTLNLKSKNWPAGPTTYTFDKDGLKWPATPTACANSKDTTKDIATIFK